MLASRPFAAHTCIAGHAANFEWASSRGTAVKQQSVTAQMHRRFAAPPPSLQSSPWHWVDTLAGLRAAAEALRTASCIAVDVEHNVSHAYLGLSCLVQLSDGERDWVIDALAVHDDMHLLRPLFADAAVLKVQRFRPICSVLPGCGGRVAWHNRLPAALQLRDVKGV